jgi:hypothetical protein
MYESQCNVLHNICLVQHARHINATMIHSIASCRFQLLSWYDMIGHVCMYCMYMNEWLISSNEYERLLT